MTISPSQAERLAIATRSVYVSAEAELTALIAKRLSQGIDAPLWATIKLSEVQRLRRETEAIIARLQAESGQAIAEAVQTAYLNGSNAALADLKAVMPAGEIVGTFGVTNQQAVARIVAEATLNVQSTHLAILRQTQDVYRRAVAEASSQAVVGVLTRREAAQRVLNQFADRGITGFVDRAGRNWALDSYAEMATRTALGRAAVQGHVDRFLANGKDLVIVSAHGGSCPICAVWEGRVLSISGATAGYPTLGEAHAAGFQHANCRHTVGLFVPGLTRKMDVQPERGREAEYSSSQTQRYLERNIRRWKRRELGALGDDERRAARAKVRAWQQRSREFASETGRRRRYDRESVNRAH